MSLLYHGFGFHRVALGRFFKVFPFRPLTLFTTKRSPVTHLPYWHRKHTSKTKLPILFIHGIGIGLLTYADFLADLNSTAGIEGGGVDDEVGIIAIEILPISFRITHPAMSSANMCTEIATILEHHGWDKVVLVAHSYGTVIATHLLKTPFTAPLIGPVVLVDPVSILLHLPDVAYNFTRRKPRRANEHQLYYFASMDMCVSHTLSRHFFWSENILWKEDLDGRNVTVSLSGNDLIVDTESVGRYMSAGNVPWVTSTASPALLINVDDVIRERVDRKALNSHASQVDSDVDEEADIEVDTWKEQLWKGKGIDVLWFENLDHAQVFDKLATRRPLLRAIKSYCTEAVYMNGGNVDI
jgi:pimeloyl-ACP methyl ester carboxylesterase